MYLSYVGIRVTDLDRSLKFYTGAFGLREIARGDIASVGGGTYVLLRDDISGQRLELNWYPATSPFSGPYVPGEGLDHVGFHVEDVADTVRRLKAFGGEEVPIEPRLSEPLPRSSPNWVKVAYVRDPDGNWIELFQYADPRRAYDPAKY